MTTSGGKGVGVMGKQETLWTVDSLPIDVLTFKFSGSVELNPYDDEDRALYEALKMGKHVEFTVTGICAGKAHTYKPPKGEGPSVTTRVATIKVDTLISDEERDRDAELKEAVQDLHDQLTEDGLTAEISIPDGGEPVVIGAGAHSE